MFDKKNSTLKNRTVSSNDFVLLLKYGNKLLEQYTLNAQYDVNSTSQYYTTTVYK